MTISLIVNHIAICQTISCSPTYDTETENDINEYNLNLNLQSNNSHQMKCSDKYILFVAVKISNVVGGSEKQSDTNCSSFPKCLIFPQTKGRL